jgi:hypothetical protein
MRSASGYMAKRGLLAGIGMMMLISFLSSIFSPVNFASTVVGSAGNDLALAGLFYLVFSFLIGAVTGAVPGVLIGLLNSAYINRLVRQKFAQITDESAYANQLALHSAVLVAALTLGAVLLYATRLALGLNILTVLLAGVVGGLVGRGYAYHDMAQRREKKRVLEAESRHEASQHKAKRRLEMQAISPTDETALENDVYAQVQQNS